MARIRTAGLAKMAAAITPVTHGLAVNAPGYGTEGAILDFVF